MRRLFQFTAIVVLALWLPTTVHCNLEAVLGWTTEPCCGDHADGSQTPVDHCAAEDGNYRLTGTLVTVDAPELQACWCGPEVCASLTVETAAPRTEPSESPPELARTWQFVARAAWPARAPGRTA